MSLEDKRLLQTSGDQKGQITVHLFSSFFIILGISAIFWLIYSIFDSEIIQTVLSGAKAETTATTSPIVAFLLEFGIIFPVLTIGLGILFIWLGFKLRTRQIGIAYWAKFALTWMSVGIIITTIFNLFQLISRLFQKNLQQDAFLDQGLLITTAVLVGILTFILLCANWLKRNIYSHFQGQENLNCREVRFAWSLLVPTLAVFILVAARPLEQTFIRSLTDKRFATQEIPNYVGLENYQQLLGIRFDTVGCRLDVASESCATAPNGSIQWENIDRELLQQGFRTVWKIQLPFTNPPTVLAVSGLDKDFLKAIGTTLLFTVISVSIELSVALFMALTVNSNFIGRGLMRAVMLVPWAIPTVISAKLWDLMLKDTSAGIVNRILMDLQIIDAPQAWLSVSSLQLPSAIMVDVWKTSPFMALLLLAGLQTIPSDLYEAAAVDGANGFQQFFSITLPLLRPTIAVALVFRTLDSLRVFDLFNVLFGRQQLSMATYNYEMLVNSQKDGYASAVSIIIFLLISIFAFIYVRMLRVETE